MIDEILSIWKPPNISSYDVVKEVQAIKKTSKVGHCGTLDPFAEGVLIICIGKYTKDVSVLMDSVKKYKAKIGLGFETDTLDIEGTIIREKKYSHQSENLILNKLKLFTGNQKQIPPYFCAKKINGVRMYKLARKDIFIRRKPNDVFIENIKFIEYSNSSLTIDITCGKGTYIRSLARDIALSLGTYGYLQSLERYQVGNYNKNNSILIEELQVD